MSNSGSITRGAYGYGVPSSSSSSSSSSSQQQQQYYQDQQHQHQHQHYLPTAPRLVIRGDLPIADVSLMDLLALYVAKSGPTVEEEVTHREAGNPAFAFLTTNPSVDPRAAYYRWRLYALLQGDSPTRHWRSEPFQMERDAAAAYVWVPPPPVPIGPDCLTGAYASFLTCGRSGNGHGEDGDPTAAPANSNTAGLLGPASHITNNNAKDTIGTSGSGGSRSSSGVSSTAVRPPPSAYWLSRLSTGEGESFGTLSETDAIAWRTLLTTTGATNAILTRYATVTAAAAATATAASNTNSIGNSGCRTNTFTAAMEQATAALLPADAIAGQMVFAIEHARHSNLGVGGAAPHVMSLVLDAMVNTAYDAAALASRMESSSSSNDNIAVDDEEYGHAATVLEASLLCTVQLSRLFLMHDIIQNCRARLLSTEEDFQTAEAQRALELDQARARRALQSSGNNSNNSCGDGPLPVPTLVTPPSPLQHHHHQQQQQQQSSSSPTLHFDGNTMGHGNFPSSMSSSSNNSNSEDSWRSAKTILKAVESILPTALEAVTITALATVSVAVAGVATHSGGSATSTDQRQRQQQQRNKQLLRVTVTAADNPMLLMGGLGGSSSGIGCGVGVSAGAKRISVAVPASPSLLTSADDDDDYTDDTGKALAVARLLLGWQSQLLCLWSNRDAVPGGGGGGSRTALLSFPSFSPSSSSGRVAGGGDGNEEESNGGSGGGGRMIHLRGRAMVLFMERYECLLPASL